LHLGERVIEVRIEAGVLGYNLTALYMIRYYRLLAQRKLVELSSRESNQ
jgi:preprotein translocase subunit SecD